MQKRSIIITAGGIGKRMQSEQPKQFLVLLGRPVLLHTLERLYAFSPDSQLILTLPEEYLEEWKRICHDYQLTVPHLAIAGGKERYHSIKKALEFCTGSTIAVHDGVRPLVSKATITRLFEASAQFTAVIPVVQPKDSLRRVSGEKSTAVLRSDYRIVQTPQVFEAELLRKAYELPFTDAITDDASLVEQLGTTIHLVEGNEENLKITTPEDLLIAEMLLRK